MSEMRQAIFYSMLNKYSLQVISFISIAILARLLTPEEVGVFAVATSLAFVATSLRTFGVGEYLVRERSIDRQKVKTVVGVMVIMSWTLGLIFMVASPWIGDFYGQPDLGDLICIIAVPFFVAPFSTIPFSLLARSMKFDSILKIELAGCLVRNGVSIGLVLYDFSYYGLAWGTLAGVLMEFAMITLYRPAEMSWIPSFRNLGKVFSAGMQISLSNLFLLSSQNSNDLILGRLSTMNNVGIYSRGLGLILFLNDVVVKAVGPVALPHLAKVKREGGDVAEAYLNAVGLVGAVALPLFAVVSLSSLAMITALFGDQWAFSAQLSSILAIWIMFQSMHCFAKQALLTAGQERLFLVKELQSLVVKVGFIVAAVPYGLTWVAWAVALSGLIDFLVVSYLLKLALDIRFWPMLKHFFPNMLVAAACWTVLRLAGMVIPLDQMNAWLSLLITGALMVPVWLVSLRLTGNSLWPFVVSVFQHLGDKVRGSRG
ncbi:hypothetical protein Kalk_14775 [Ketobacter alkanivorans]|uniref:Uncharacterized protein n=2 Tax=Ketobacter alkanivorans TaxID=1917421 RepID=A0A2K9LMZ4_9GAMM|nr:hypothetical protein Kalk_14775 [Ketobacter alkanivorans]